MTLLSELHCQVLDAGGSKFKIKGIQFEIVPV